MALPYQQLKARDVLAGVEQNALGAQTVPPSSTSLLVVVLQALRQDEMDNVSDMSVIYSHSKGDGRHHYCYFPALPTVLNLLAVWFRHAGVVVGCLDVQYVQNSAVVSRKGGIKCVFTLRLLRILF